MKNKLNIRILLIFLLLFLTGYLISTRNTKQILTKKIINFNKTIYYSIDPSDLTSHLTAKETDFKESYLSPLQNNYLNLLDKEKNDKNPNFINIAENRIVELYKNGNNIIIEINLPELARNQNMVSWEKIIDNYFYWIDREFEKILNSKDQEISKDELLSVLAGKINGHYQIFNQIVGRLEKQDTEKQYLISYFDKNYVSLTQKVKLRVNKYNIDSSYYSISSVKNDFNFGEYKVYLENLELKDFNKATVMYSQNKLLQQEDIITDKLYIYYGNILINENSEEYLSISNVSENMIKKQQWKESQTDDKFKEFSLLLTDNISQDNYYFSFFPTNDSGLELKIVESFNGTDNKKPFEKVLLSGTLGNNLDKKLKIQNLISVNKNDSSGLLLAIKTSEKLSPEKIGNMNFEFYPKFENKILLKKIIPPAVDINNVALEKKSLNKFKITFPDNTPRSLIASLNNGFRVIDFESKNVFIIEDIVLLRFYNIIIFLSFLLFVELILYGKIKYFVKKIYFVLTKYFSNIFLQNLNKLGIILFIISLCLLVISIFTKNDYIYLLFILLMPAATIFIKIDGDYLYLTSIILLMTCMFFKLIKILPAGELFSQWTYLFLICGTINSFIQLLGYCPENSFVSYVCKKIIKK